MRLADFVAHPDARACSLSEAMVVVLRFYSTAAFRSINDPLRDQAHFVHPTHFLLLDTCSLVVSCYSTPIRTPPPGLLLTANYLLLTTHYSLHTTHYVLRHQARFSRKSAHPLPVTVAFLNDAIKKLRALAAQHSNTHDELCLYRGLKDVRLPGGFMRRGGTEMAPMSTTMDLRIALEYSQSKHAVLLRVRSQSFMDRGVDITFFSAFPAEREYLYPPFAYIQPTGATERITIDGASFHIVDVRAVMS